MPSQVVTVPCKYKTARTLGQGSYAVVKEAIEIETGKYFAAKVLNKSLMRGREHLIRNEIGILRKISLGHPNILSMVDCFETANNLYIVTELATGGELFERIYEQGSFFEQDAAKLINTIVDSVQYLHEHGIVHRDLKPENLLFKTPADDSPLLIADFGLSKIIASDSDALSTTCGTPNYMAPEVFTKSGHGKPVDMWAIGVIAYFLLSGYPPFDVSDDYMDYSAILSGSYSFVPEYTWNGVSETAKDFIRRLIVVEPSSRLTAKEAYNHPWLVEFRKSSSPAELDEALNKVSISEEPKNLLPGIRENFNARKTFRKAVGLVRVLNKVRLPAREPHLPTEEDISQVQMHL